MKRQINKMVETDAVILQLLAGNKQSKELIRQAIFDFCKKKNIDVVIRLVKTTDLENNLSPFKYLSKRKK